MKIKKETIVYCETLEEFTIIQTIAFDSEFTWAGYGHAKHLPYFKNYIYFEDENILRYSDSSYLETTTFKERHSNWKLYNASDLLAKYLIKSL